MVQTCRARREGARVQNPLVEWQKSKKLDCFCSADCLRLIGRGSEQGLDTTWWQVGERSPTFSITLPHNEYFSTLRLSIALHQPSHCPSLSGRLPRQATHLSLRFLIHIFPSIHSSVPSFASATLLLLTTSSVFRCEHVSNSFVLIVFYKCGHYKPIRSKQKNALRLSVCVWVCVRLIER